MRPIQVTVGPLAAASANNIATSQTPVSGTALTLNGAAVSNGVAVLDQPRRVLLTYGNEGAGRTMVLTGTGATGLSQSETLVVPSGAGGTVASALDYKTVTSLVPAGGGYTAAVTAGTNAMASTPWVRLDEWAFPQVALQCTVNGTVTYSVQQTLDDPNNPSNPVAPPFMTWVDHPDTNLVAATATKQGNYAYAPIFTRATITAGTGTVTYTVVQANQFAG